MSFFKKLLSQSAIYGVSSVLGRVINLILVPLLTAKFTLADYGVFSDLFAYTTVFLVLLTFGMETSFFRFSMDKERTEDAFRQSFLTVLGLSTLFLIAFGLNHKWVSTLLGYGERPELVLMVIFIIYLDVISAVPKARLRHEEKAVYFSIVSLVNIFVNIGLSLIFIVGMGKGVEYAFLSILIASIVRVAMLLPWSRPNSWKWDKELGKTMAKYGLYIMIAGLAGVINENLDKMLITRMWEDGKEFLGAPRKALELTGIYSANYKLAIFITLVTQAFRFAAEPLFFKQAKDRNSPLLFARVFYYFVTATLLMFMIISSFKLEIVSFDLWGTVNFTFINEKFWIGLGVVPILLLANVFLAAYTQLSIWFKITKQVRFGLLFMGVGAVITILINVVTIPWAGYLGSAWATLICYAVVAFLCWRIGQRYYPIPYPIGRILVILGLCIAAWLFNDFVWDESFWTKFLVCAVVTLGIVGFEWKFRFMPKAAPEENPDEVRRGAGKGENRMKE